MNVRQLKLFLEKLFNSLDQNGKVVLFSSLLNVVLSESEMNSVERDNLSLKEKIDSLSEEYERLRLENTELRSKLNMYEKCSEDSKRKEQLYNILK
jgi:regulator of replication initiation timing